MSHLRTAMVSLLPAYIKPASVAERFLQRQLASKTLLGGPFRGMRYSSESVGSVLVPKQLGCYETELEDVIERYISAQPTTVMDVGAAEGYYAVGFALRCPNSRVIAFEGEETGRNILRQLAELNAVTGRVEINGFCGTDTFELAVAKHRPDLVIMDIEGGEGELLEARAVPLLAKSDLIVELHPWVCPTIEDDLKRRFGKTHKAEVVHARPRTRADLPFGSLHNFLYARWFVPKLNELRPEPMRWLILTTMATPPDE